MHTFKSSSHIFDSFTYPCSVSATSTNFGHFLLKNFCSINLNVVSSVIGMWLDSFQAITFLAETCTPTKIMIRNAGVFEQIVQVHVMNESYDAINQYRILWFPNIKFKCSNNDMQSIEKKTIFLKWISGGRDKDQAVMAYSCSSCSSLFFQATNIFVFRVFLNLKH